MEELFSSWTEKLKEDILLLSELESKNKTQSKHPEEDSKILLNILNELWEAGEDGNLCIPVQKEWKNFLKTKPPALVVEKIGNKEWVYFEKTFRTKTELETLLEERIRGNIRTRSDLVKAESILKKLESKSFDLKKGQVRSILSCLSSSFQIISGGPGTGKTTVVAFLLQILNELGELPPAEEIALVAPTGRAAQRLTESIQENLKRISDSDQNRFLRGQTIHGLLSYKPSLGGFYYNRERFLPHRLVIVDEVSMVDVNLMLSLFQALPKDRSFRLILIGDPNQLPSVEKGAVLSDFLSVLESENGNHISRLEESNRQKRNSKGEVSKIVTLAEEILKYDPENLNLGTRIDDAFPKTDTIGENVVYKTQVVWLQNSSKTDPDVLTRDEVVEQLWERIFLPQILRISSWKINDGREFTDSNFVRTFQNELGRFRCLTVFRKGYWGVESIQNRIMNLAAQDFYGRITSAPVQNLFPKRLAKRLYFVGLPILITQNDKSRKLFNGDIGIVLRTGNTGELRAVFPIDDRLYPFALDTLPKHEPAFVMSIHKSQGSEYDTILIYLPDGGESAATNFHKLLNRQVLYTGITRAKNQVILAGNPKTFELGIENIQKRNTGFRIRINP
ncbi:exodeoxyribonuclease V subunit alpha [Leptospira adleri]|uniref:exodeoxyribonuclease V subunit alpha n=1 Tax=Leptospira adleri TaxID=2023186 RepID=UPI0010848BFC|nr:exodeoxyribonuclease V subunit alpha [Leptospira adleri]TGM58437.1 exodeoxyribonuclease V subunit alpha [Leptospira adleri]